MEFSRLKAILITITCLLLFMTIGYGQRNTILQIQEALDTLQSTRPLEKLYVHLDKSDYLLGDTIWYKAYVMDGISGGLSPMSGIVYVELIDGPGNLVQRSRQVLVAGSTHGEFILDPTVLKPGKFTLRAYTRWLQNFGANYFHHREIEVSGDYFQDWTVDLVPVTLFDTAGRQTLTAAMALREIKGNKVDVQPVTVELLRGGKSISRHRKVVDTLGRLAAVFDLPPRWDVDDLEMVIRTDEAVKVRFPLREGLPSTRYDVQFLPESGRWLAGVSAVMGIKAIDQQGMGVAAKGVILDAADEEIARFSCTDRGMGRVPLPPLPTGNYRARVAFPDGSEGVYPLPNASAEGVVLHYGDERGLTAHIPLRVTLSAAFRRTGLLLIGQSRGTLHYGAVLNAKDSVLTTSIPRAYFPEGIIHFSVLDAAGRPLASRLVYNNPQRHRLHIALAPHRPDYGPRDSIALHIRVTDSLGRPVQGNFSLAVTADSQFQADTLDGNIYSDYFLSSDLQGHVEDPWFYFSTDTAAPVALDNLLLTQGWVKYDQTLLAEMGKPRYAPEPRFEITGTVANVFGNKLENTRVTVLGVGDVPFFADTLTDGQGHFAFRDIPAFDTAGFVIQARNKRDKSFNVGITLETDTEPPALPAVDIHAAPRTWFVNLDTTLRKRVVDHREYLERRVGGGMDSLRSILLQEVTVTGRRVVRGSKNLNGPGASDQALGEEELLEDAEKTLLQILYEKIDGFRLGIFPPRVHGKPEFMVQDKKARLIFDGMDLEFFYDPQQATSDRHHMEFLKSYLEQYTGEDLLGVEVMYSMKYSGRYSHQHLSPEEIQARMATATVYIEITTRGGSGPFMRKTPGVVHFRPMPFTWPREFYRPRYPVDGRAAAAADLRTTIHWVPMLFTDEKGEATVSFYASDRPDSYTIRMNGMDGRGNFGTLNQRLILSSDGVYVSR